MCVQDVKLGRSTVPKYQQIPVLGGLRKFADGSADRIRLIVGIDGYTTTIQKTVAVGGDLIDYVYYATLAIGPRVQGLFAEMVTLTAAKPYAVLKIEDYGTVLLGELYYEQFEENTLNGAASITLKVIDERLVAGLKGVEEMQS